MDNIAKFNEEEYMNNLIRNEKVGCSIHLSGTTQIKKSRYLNHSGFFSPDGES